MSNLAYILIAAIIIIIGYFSQEKKVYKETIKRGKELEEERLVFAQRLLIFQQFGGGILDNFLKQIRKSPNWS